MKASEARTRTGDTAVRLTALAHHVRGNPCLLLLAGLLAALALAPWLESRHGTLLVNSLAAVAIGSAIRAVAGGAATQAALLALGATTLALGAAAQGVDSDLVRLAALAAYVVFGVATLVRILVYVLQPGAITADKIYGALSVYLLAGFTWGGGYALTELLNPGSFEWMPGIGQQPRTLLRSFTYLSFVTLATLGYGDITPVTPQARSLAILEALFGVFYVVVIMARLVAGFEGLPGGRRREP